MWRAVLSFLIILGSLLSAWQVAGQGMLTLGAGSAGGAAYTGPGDVVSGATIWGGLRAYSAATVSTKSANVCNSGDANCADINTLANGKFDVATAQGAPLNCGGAGGTCTIKTLYDKSGNGNDLTNATAGARPTLVFNCLGSLPCMACASASTQHLLTVAIAYTPPYTWVGVGKLGTGGGFQTLIGGNGTPILTSAAANTWSWNSAGGSEVDDGAATDGSWHAAQGSSLTTTSNTITIYRDGTTTTTTGTSTGTAGQAVALCDRDNLDLAWNGNVAEVGVWPSAFASSALNSNIHNYWGF